MGIGTALVDKARTIRRTEDALQEVDGEKVMIPTNPVEGPWFRCRIYGKESTEIQGDGRRKRVTRYNIMTGRKSNIKAADTIETQSKQMGNAKYQVDGDPKPIRKRRTIIGYTARLVKSE